MFHSLHARLGVAFALALLGFAAGLSFIGLRIGSHYEREVRQLLNREVAEHVAKDARLVTGGALDKGALKQLFSSAMLLHPAIEIYVLDPQGRILAHDAPPGRVQRERVDLAPVQELLEGAERLVEGDDPRRPGHRAPISVAPLALEGGEGLVYVILGGEELTRVASEVAGRHALSMAGWGAALLAALALAGALTALGWLTRPVRALRSALAPLAEGGLPRTVQHRGEDELAELVHDHNRMVRRIRDQVEGLRAEGLRRREFVASVSHDLRTPLASLEGYLELLSQPEEGIQQGERERYVSIARRRARHLSRLVDQLFELARLEAGDVLAHPEEVCLAELAADVCAGLSPAARRAGVRLSCALPREGALLNVDAGLCERALENLVSNAVRYTPRGGQVQVRVRPRASSVRVEVLDTGQGLSEEDEERIFERRYRGSVQGRAPGAGLGLAITRSVAELHGGSVHTSKAEGWGAAFVLTLPHDPPEAPLEWQPATTHAREAMSANA